MKIYATRLSLRGTCCGSIRHDETLVRAPLDINDIELIFGGIGNATMQ
jgi:hypothetical protein